MDRMSKNGFKEKFIKTFLLTSVIVWIVFMQGSRDYSGEAIVGQYVYAAFYMLIPSAVIALIWEFFK